MMMIKGGTLVLAAVALTLTTMSPLALIYYLTVCLHKHCHASYNKNNLIN